MNKFWLGVQGYTSCFGWIFAETAKALVEKYPDLAFWKPPTHLDDFIWYAERVNGRLAMLALTVLAVHKYIDIIQKAHYVN